MIPLGILAAARQQVSGAAPVTWSPTFKGADVVLSAGNSRISRSVGTGWQSALGTRGHNAGKRQFELVAIANAVNVLAGVANEDFASFTEYIGSPTSTSGSGSLGFHFQAGASWYEHLESNTSANAAHAAGIDVGEVFTVGVDFDADTVKFYENGTLLLTRSGFTSLGSKLWYPAGAVISTGMVELRGSGLAHPIAGYTNWNAP